MLLHMSIEADDPRQVANVLAELWGGVATPFPPISKGSWCALAGDERNSMIEVYPRGTVLVEASGDADAYGEQAPVRRGNATHMAIATDLGADDVLAIAQREDWHAKYRKRGGAFGVIELWIEGCQMVEVLTPEMQTEYRQTMTVDGWMGFLGSVGAAA